MGRLYDALSQIDAEIQRQGLDTFKTKGLISREAGFFLVTVRPDTPDDLERIDSLRSAVKAVLRADINI